MTKVETKAKPRKKAAAKRVFVPAIEHKGFGFAKTRSGHVAVFRRNAGLLEGVLFFEDTAPDGTQWRLDGSEFTGEAIERDLVAPYDPPKEREAWMLVYHREPGHEVTNIFNTREDAESEALAEGVSVFSIIRLTGREGAE